jgi:hypothetical protein
VGSALISDTIIDNFVSPRVMSNALKIHPAAVLVTVFISASLFGFIGVLLSAPVLASLKLISTYVLNKLMDLDPWDRLDTFPPPQPLSRMFYRFRMKIKRLFLGKKAGLRAIQKAQDSDLPVDDKEKLPKQD